MFSPPKRPVPRKIFDVLQAEARHRANRPVETWQEAEARAVLEVVNAELRTLGRAPATFEEILRVDRSACGHVDFLWKYAYGAEELIEKKCAAKYEPPHLELVGNLHDVLKSV